MTNLASTQVEQLQRIGSYLQQVRQEQGLSLESIANATFIRLPLLQAIESGRDQDLPQAIFIQGFIRRYADSLGLDGRALSQEFPVHAPPLPSSTGLLTEVNDRSFADNPPVTEGKATTAPLKVHEPPTPDQFSPKERTKPRPRVKLEGSVRSPQRSRSALLPWVLALGGLALAGVGLAAVLRSSPRPAPPQLSETPKPPSSTPATVPAPTPAANASPQPPAAPSAPVMVKVILSDRSWLSITADGKSLYKGVATKGYQKTWSAQKNLVIETGNAGAVSLAVNGDAPVVAGPAGDVKTFTFTPTSKAAAIASP